MSGIGSDYPLTILKTRLSKLLPSKACFNVQNSYKTHPKAQISDLLL